MKKISKIKLLIVLSITILSTYFLINFTIGDDRFKNLKSFLDNNQKEFIKKYIFPYKLISQQEENISQQKENISQQEERITKQKIKLDLLSSYLPNLEVDFIKSGSDIKISKSIIELTNKRTLEKYKLDKGFYNGISKFFPGSGYIDFYENNMFILSSRGVLAYKKNLTDVKINFKQIKHNISYFIGLDEFKKYRWFSLKDILIFKNKIYISYTEEIEKNCWNTSIIYGNINYENIQFQKLFSPKECVHESNNIDKEFIAGQSGGRIVVFNDNHILLSVGDYRSRHLAQNKKSINGKVITININDNKHQIISMGHRNPQGLYFDKENNFILETEHGPFGGDEINLIEVEEINGDKIQNYGWAIASAGEHYGGRIEKNKKKYKKYPLYKSHIEHGFIEPLKSFVPSIAISEIIKIGKNKYVVGSMGQDREGDKSLYFFELNNKKKIINLEQVKVFERVRDLRFKDKKLYLFMENTASIGVMHLN